MWGSLCSVSAFVCIFLWQVLMFSLCLIIQTDSLILHNFILDQSYFQFKSIASESSTVENYNLFVTVSFSSFVWIYIKTLPSKQHNNCLVGSNHVTLYVFRNGSFAVSHTLWIINKSTWNITENSYIRVYYLSESSNISNRRTQSTIKKDWFIKHCVLSRTFQTV